MTAISSGLAAGMGKTGPCGPTGSNGGMNIAAPKRAMPVDNDPIDPEAKARADWFHKLDVKPLAGYQVHEYHAVNREWRFPNTHVMQECEKVWRLMFCHVCKKAGPDPELVLVHPLFAVYEKDELDVFPALAHVTCHYCGFEEYYPTSNGHKSNSSVQHEIICSGKIS